MILLLLAACDGHPVVESPDSGGPIGHDSAPAPDDSTEVLPTDDSTDTHESTPPHDTAETGDTDVAAEVPDVVVDCAGGGTYTTITAAITASRSGTKIGLAPCTYTENVDFTGKALDIFGMEGSAATIIHGTGSGTVVSARHGETVGTRLAGVTIENGGYPADYYGSALRTDGAVLTLDDVVFSGNTQGYAVVYATGSMVTATDLSFTGNRVESGGGILIVDNGSFLAQRMTLDCDNADYGVYVHMATMVLDSTVTCGRGIGFDVEGNDVQVRRSRVESGSSYAIYGEDNPDTRNERMWLFDSAFVGGDTAVYALYMHVKVGHSVFYADRTGLDLEYGHIDSYVHDSVGVGSSCGIKSDGYAYDIGWNAYVNSGRCGVDGYGTVTSDPMFVDAPDDFHPAAGSPLIDAGDPSGSNDDVDHSRGDIGMYGGPEGDGEL